MEFVGSTAGILNNIIISYLSGNHKHTIMSDATTDPARRAWGVHQSSQTTTYSGSTITASSAITNNSNITMQAGTHILMNPGFSVAANNNLFAYIAGSGTVQWEYTIKDHLGNTRIAYSDINNDGVVATPSEILQENNYACPVRMIMRTGNPFGYDLSTAHMNHANADNLYQYNGKEKNDDHGIGMYDYGARWYDAGVGRFTTIDRFADKYGSLTPYNYTANNPIRYVDVNGDSIGVNIINGGGANGRDLYQFTVTGTVIDNTSDGLTTRELMRFKRGIEKGIRKSFTGSDGQVEFTVNTNISISNSEDQINSTDHVFRITDDLQGSGETKGESNLKVAGSTPPYQNVVYLDSKSPGTLQRTAAHELGHSAGLGHIKDSYQQSNGQLRRLTVNDYPSNLMHQSRDVSYPGSRLAEHQIRHIGVLAQNNKLNKGAQR